MTRSEYHRQIDYLMKEAEKNDSLIPWMREMCLTDIYFLGVYVLGRTDLDHIELPDGSKQYRDWLFDRCMEVQEEPDGYIDIWARDHYKDLACDTPILTSTGWKPHGDLQVGDYVYTPKGLSKVVATRHFTDSHCMKVKFRGNQEIVCGAGHLWKVMKWNSARVKGDKRVGWESVVCETSDLMSSYKHPYIPVTGYNSKDVELPIAPYTLGAWLGDGDNSSGRICGIDNEVFDSIKNDGYMLSHSHCQSRHPFQTRTVYGLSRRLRKLGLLRNKHIPTIYFTASYEQRLALLQGLMDTDGNMSKSYGNGATFVQKKKQLSYDVLALINSLGFRAGVCKARNAYMITFSVANDDPIPFRVKRKIENISILTSQKQSKNWYVQSVCEHETVPTNCIQIEDPDGIYLAGHALIPTHNSTLITFLKTIQDILIDPEITCCIYSYSSSAATKFLKQIKLVLESSEKLKQLFPDILFDDVTKPFWTDERGVAHKMIWSELGLRVKRQSNAKEHTIEASGLVIGQRTGGHYNLLVYDDVVTPESVTSPEMIKKTTTQFEMSLNTGSSGNMRVRIIGTRYHYADTYQSIIEKGTAKLRMYPCVDAKGEPVLYTKEVIELKKRNMGSGVFASQMMCDPKQASTMGFKNEWLRVWDGSSVVNLNLYIIIDPAGTKTKKADYTVMWVIGLGADKNYYIVDLIRDKFDLTGKTAMLFRLVRDYTFGARKPQVFYEKAAMQSDIEHIEYVMNQTNYRFSITPMTATVPKGQRIEALEPLFREGRVWIPKACWHRNWEGQMEDMLTSFVNDEYLAYPFAGHDDGLDSLSRIADTDTGSKLAFPDEITMLDHQRALLESRGVRFQDITDIPYEPI